MTDADQYTQPGHANPDRYGWLTPGLLVLANLIPFAGILLWGWEVGQILLFYWSENLLVGAFNVLRILSYSLMPPRQGRALFLAGFFTLHYGGFCAAHGAVLLSLLDYPPAAPSAVSSRLADVPLLGLLAPAIDTALAIAPPLWLMGFAALAASHAVSFVFNFLLRNERAATSPAALMMTPYQRILILHVVLIVGGIAVSELGEPLLLLVLLVALKIIIDLRAHLRERRNTLQVV